MKYTLVLLGFSSLISIGCSVGYHTTLFRPVPPNHGHGEIQLWADDQKPPCEYQEIGLISTDGQYGTEDSEILAELRRQVAKAGCDGVVKLKKGEVGTIGQGLWQGSLYVCK